MQGCDFAGLAETTEQTSRRVEENATEVEGDIDAQSKTTFLVTNETALITVEA